MSPSTDNAAGVPGWQLWFGLLAPPTAWIVHGVASVLVALNTCHHRGAPSPGTRPALVAISVFALGFTVLGGLAGYGAFRRLSRGGDPARTEAGNRLGMLAVGGAFFGVVFTLGVLWGALPAFMLSNLCGAIP